MHGVADTGQDAPLAPGLYLVATPIGNLEDITLRALRVLRQVDRIACEDTRQTQKLLNHFGISTPTVSYHQHNERGRASELMNDLKHGSRLALVSDAGTPGIADPGAEIASLAIAAGIPVHPIPGPNAAVAAIVGSGLLSHDSSAEQFRFCAFLPAKAGQRRTELERLRAQSEESGICIFYEAPHRIVETLADIAAIFGPNQHVVVARELTKIHEEYLRGPVGEVHSTLSARETVRGEIVLLFVPAPPVENAASGQSLAAEVRALMREQSLTEKDALKRVARARGIGKSEAYREFQRDRNS